MENYVKYTAYTIKDKCMDHLWALYWMYIIYQILLCTFSNFILTALWGGHVLPDQEMEIQKLKVIYPERQSQAYNPGFQNLCSEIQLPSSFKSICLGVCSKGENIPTNCLALHQFNTNQPVGELNYSLFTWLFCHLVHTSILWLRMKNIFHKTVQLCPWHVLFSTMLLLFFF